VLFDRNVCFYVAGLVLVDQSRAEQQTTIRILHADHTFGPLSSKGDGGNRPETRLELHIHHIRRVQLRYQSFRGAGKTVAQVQHLHSGEGKTGQRLGRGRGKSVRRHRR